MLMTQQSDVCCRQYCIVCNICKGCGIWLPKGASSVVILVLGSALSALK